MNEQFYFYVSKGGEGDEFIGFHHQDDKNDYETVKIGRQSIHVKYSKKNFTDSIMAPRSTHLAKGIKGKIIKKVNDLWGSLISALLSFQRTVNVIVVSGEGFTEKQRVLDEYEKRRSFIRGSMCERDYHDLGELMREYFTKLAAIARTVYAKEMLGDWQPESIAVITHWGGSGVGKREESLAKAVSYIADEQFKKWRTVASSSARKEAFPKGFNPFLHIETEKKASLPNAEVCEILVAKLPMMDIDWTEVKNATGAAELKKHYDKLMLNLNH